MQDCVGAELLAVYNFAKFSVNILNLIYLL